ncbi:MAG: hypothetical protein KAW92_11420 [Candidatus Cloacimonetes bacterium]|nr:hypothetical protein [Candidatus Cloacimonadota bacterium]
MNRILVSISFSIILIVGLLGCSGQQSQGLKYEKAKRRAEEKITELEEILKPVRALERGDFSALPTDPDSLKSLSEKANIQTIKKLSDEVNKAMRRVFELKPEGYDDDYKQWTQKMKQRLGSIK